MSNFKIFSLGLLSCLMILFSLPCAFIVFSYIAYSLFSKKVKLKSFWIFISSPLPILSLYYIYILKPSKALMFEQYYGLWKEGFISSFSSLPVIFKQNIIFFFDSNNFFIYLILFVGGFYFVLKHIKLKRNFLFAQLFFYAVLASIFQIYPLRERVILYLLPFLILTFAIFLDSTIFKVKEKKYNVFFLFFLFFIIILSGTLEIFMQKLTTKNLMLLNSR